MFEDERGPIERFSWGLFVIGGEEHGESEAGKVGVGKDVRLIGTEVSRWKQRKGHRLTEEMITGVFGRDLDVLVIGTGVHGALECPRKVREAILAQGFSEVILEPTPKACAVYSKLYREGKRVALLAHGTC